MQSKIVALFADEGGREAILLFRRGDGQFALSRIDARVAAAARLADRYALTPAHYSSLGATSPKR
ncbi:MAG: hypothetical protein M3O26_00340 [Pseudomonadota bacterium]|nr:hypothetical protein [Pseudomonadota bacterium]